MMASYMSSINKTNQVVLFEKNEKLGKKLFITGKGRCNVTNACDISTFKKNIITNEKFMYSSLTDFDNKTFIKFLEENNCPIKIERGLRVFPKSDKSYAITDCFKKLLKQNGVNIFLNEEVIDVNIKTNDCINSFEIITLKNNKKNIYLFDKLIIATGGLSYKTTGSTGSGYVFAKKFGINTIKTIPSLVPMVIKEKFVKLDGLLLKNINLSIYQNNKKIYEDFGDLEFYKYGITGPLVLKASSKLLNNKNVFIEEVINENYYKFNTELQFVIDLKPALSNEQLDNRIIKEIEKLDNKNDLFELFRKFLPIELVDLFINNLKKYNADIIYNVKWTKELRKKIIYLLKNFQISVEGLRGFDEAIITKGGIDCKQINPKTMESKFIKNLYFAGEVLDIDCLTGGFNITIAAVTGYTAGKYATK